MSLHPSVARTLQCCGQEDTGWVSQPLSSHTSKKTFHFCIENQVNWMSTTRRLANTSAKKHRVMKDRLHCSATKQVVFSPVWEVEKRELLVLTQISTQICWKCKVAYKSRHKILPVTKKMSGDSRALWEHLHPPSCSRAPFAGSNTKGMLQPEEDIQRTHSSTDD